MVKLIALIIGAYLIGSIPIGYLVGRIFFRRDIRTAGSGNIGATNALRAFGTTVGVIILLLDMLKGFGTVMLAKSVLGVDSGWIAACGMAAILGHIFTIFLRFKGGKGVATAGGVFLALAPLALLLTLLSFIVITAITRYVSLGSILGALGFGIMVIVQQTKLANPDYPLILMSAAVVFMIIIKHKDNIRRLISGTENRIKFTKKGSV